MKWNTAALSRLNLRQQCDILLKMGLMGEERRGIQVELCVKCCQHGSVGGKMRDVIPEERDVIPEERDVAQGREGRVLRSELCQTPGETCHVRSLSGYTRATYLVECELKKIRSEWMTNRDC